MKKIIGILSVIVLMLGLLSAVSLAASDEKISGDFTYIVLDDGTAEITEYKGKAETLTVPSVLDGKKVTSIGYGAFSEADTLRTLTIPDSVLEIKTAFIHNEGIEKIVLGKNVKTLYDSAFLAALSLKTVTVPTENKYFSSSDGILYNKNKDKLIYVPVNKGLESFTVSAKVKTIGSNALRYITLKSLTLSEGIETIEKHGIAVNGIKELIIPASVSEIKDYGIYHCEELEKLTIREGALKALNTLAVSSCDKLKEIIIPANVQSIGCFYDDRALEKITVDTDNAFYKTVDGVLFSKDGKTLFRFPPAKTSSRYVVPSDVKVIVDNAFYSATLKEIFIPETVEEIEELAFAYTHFVIYTNAPSMPAKWKDALAGRTVHYNCPDETKLFTGVPTELKAKQSTSTIVLSWNAVDSAEGYRVFQKIDGKWSKLKKLGTVKGTSYRIKALEDGTKYSFAVKAYTRRDGKVIWSDKFASISTATMPAVTKKVIASQSTSAIALKWSKVEGATGYRVFIYNPSTEKYEKVKTTTGLTAKATGLKAGATYQFKVKAYIKVGGSTVWGKSTEAFAAATKTKTPEITSAISSSKGKAVVSWKDVSGESGYVLYYAASKDGEFKRVDNYTKNTVKAVADRLTSGNTYYFKLRTYKRVGDVKIWSGYSAVQSVKIK